MVKSMLTKCGNELLEARVYIKRFKGDLF